MHFEDHLVSLAFQPREEIPMMAFRVSNNTLSTCQESTRENDVK